MLSPKEKAKELIIKFWSIGGEGGEGGDTILNWEEAKIAATISANELLDMSKIYCNHNIVLYWQGVISEIERCEYCA